MESVLLALAALACPVGMGLMMVMMARSNRKADAPRPDASADELRAEHARLMAEIERREREEREPAAGAERRS